MKKTKKVKKEVNPPVSLYKATVKSFGKIFTATGETEREAILNLKPGNVKGVCVLTIEKGDKKKDKILTAPVASRLFNGHGITRDIAIKNASLLFGI